MSFDVQGVRGEIDPASLTIPNLDSRLSKLEQTNTRFSEVATSLVDVNKHIKEAIKGKKLSPEQRKIIQKSNKIKADLQKTNKKIKNSIQEYSKCIQSNKSNMDFFAKLLKKESNDQGEYTVNKEDNTIVHNHKGTSESFEQIEFAEALNRIEACFGDKINYVKSKGEKLEEIVTNQIEATESIQQRIKEASDSIKLYSKYSKHYRKDVQEKIQPDIAKIINLKAVLEKLEKQVSNDVINLDDKSNSENLKSVMEELKNLENNLKQSQSKIEREFYVNAKTIKDPFKFLFITVPYKPFTRELEKSSFRKELTIEARELTEELRQKITLDLKTRAATYDAEIDQQSAGSQESEVQIKGEDIEPVSEQISSGNDVEHKPESEIDNDQQEAAIQEVVQEVPIEENPDLIAQDSPENSSQPDASYQEPPRSVKQLADAIAPTLAKRELEQRSTRKSLRKTYADDKQSNADLQKLSAYDMFEKAFNIHLKSYKSSQDPRSIFENELIKMFEGVLGNIIPDELDHLVSEDLEHLATDVKGEENAAKQVKDKYPVTDKVNITQKLNLMLGSKDFAELITHSKSEECVKLKNIIFETLSNNNSFRKLFLQEHSDLWKGLLKEFIKDSKGRPLVVKLISSASEKPSHSEIKDGQENRVLSGVVNLLKEAYLEKLNDSKPRFNFKLFNRSPISSEESAITAVKALLSNVATSKKVDLSNFVVKDDKAKIIDELHDDDGKIKKTLEQIVGEVNTSEQSFSLGLSQIYQFAENNKEILGMPEKSISLEDPLKDLNTIIDSHNSLQNMLILAPLVQLYSEKIQTKLRAFKIDELKVQDLFNLFNDPAWSTYTKLIEIYAENYVLGSKILEDMKKDKKMASIINSPATPNTNLTIASLLITPIQRLPRWVMLFKEIEKNAKLSTSFHEIPAKATEAVNIRLKFAELDIK